VIVTTVISTITCLNDQILHATSPIFPMQNILDEYEDWNQVPNQTEYNIYPEIANDVSSCVINQISPIDISSINYQSNGKYLNVTLWLAKEPIIPIANSSIREIGVQIDIKSTYDASSSDFAYMFTLMKEGPLFQLSEYDQYNDRLRYIEKEIVNDTKFKMNANYASFSLDLQKINSPKEYRLNFVVQDTFMNNGKFCKLLDITDYFPVPSPKYNISLSEDTLFLKPGEVKEIEMKIDTDGKFKSRSETSFPKVKDINITISPVSIDILPNSLSTSLIEVKPSLEADPRPYTFTIISEIYPNEPLYSGFQELIGRTPHKITEVETSLTVVVQEPLGIIDYISNILTVWGAPIKETFALITTIGGAGITGWFLNKFRKNKKRRKQKST
jgi:hypothetical protein